MGLYEVMLGIDRAARDTGRRLTLTVVDEDKLSAAIQAERIADRLLPDPKTQYSHAMNVRQITGQIDALAAMPVAA